MKTTFMKDSLDNVFALSCVENYILGYLKLSGINISLLYYDSYISIGQIIYDFFKQHSRFDSYYSIARIQDLAMQLGIIDLDSFKSNSLLFSEGYEYLCCVKPEFLIKKYGMPSWRVDHYFYIKKWSSCILDIINDNPRDEFSLSMDEFMEIYKGEYIRFKCNNDIKFDNTFFLCRFLTRINDEYEYKYNVSDVLDIAKVRDAIGILKISRNRIEQFCANYMDITFLRDHVKKINELYAFTEYSRLKGCRNLSKIITYLDMINANDQLIINQIKSNINKGEGINYGQQKQSY